MQDIYRTFLEFVGNDLQSERRVANRRMLSVFIWCFLAPVVLSVLIILLVKLGALPPRARANLDWLILICPVVYSLYILGSEVITGIPSIFRRGGLVVSLKDAQKQGEWRDRVCSAMIALPLKAADWEWVVASFRIDLRNILYRAKYLTALAGAVFFLIFQGIDSLTEVPDLNMLRNPGFGWLETSNELSELMALILVLVLLYLSGSQAYQSLVRYLDCVELVAFQKRHAKQSE
jgi:hypothetical protein